MEKIIYIYTISKETKKGGIRQALAGILGLPYPIVETERCFLEIPVKGYGILGMTDDDVVMLKKLEKQNRQQGTLDASNEKVPARDCGMDRRRKLWQCRFDRTLRKIKKELQKKEMQNVTGLDAFLFCSWEEVRFPTELILSFYWSCRKDNLFVFRAEQLIFLDGWEMQKESLWTEEVPDDTISMDRAAPDDTIGMDRNAPELTVMEAIYTTYNYVTIVTARMEAWQAFVEMAYEEYGLSVRCARDSESLTFRDKKTLVVDLARSGKRCIRNFPESSVYLDMHWTKEKRRRIAAKCGKIPYLSLWNALDTLQRDGV